MCFSEKPFHVFQLFPREQITRWWTPLTSWSHVSSEAAYLLKRELFSRRTLLTGRSLNVRPLNPSHRANGNVYIAPMVSRTESEMFILSSSVSQWEEHEIGSGSPGSMRQPCCRPAVWSSLVVLGAPDLYCAGVRVS